MRGEPPGEGLQDQGVTGAPQVDDGAVCSGDPREEPKAYVAAPQVGLEAALLLRPAAAERPHVGVRRVAAATVAEPVEGAVEQRVVGKVREGQGCSTLAGGETTGPSPCAASWRKHAGSVPRGRSLPSG